MVTFGQVVVNGLALGSIYLLIAIGLVLVFSVLKVVNFAHGELLMVGGYLVYLGLEILRWGVAGTSLILIAGMVLLGAIVYVGVMRPALRRPPINQLVATFAVAVLLQNGVQLLLGADVRSLRLEFATVEVLGLAIYGPTLVGIVLSLTMLTALAVVLRRTEFGIIVRAVAQDRAAAEVAGIRTSLVCGLVFVFGTVLAGLGGLFLALSYSLTPHAGAEYTLKAFAVAVLAGMGNIGAAAATSLLLGLGESLVGVYQGSRAINLVTYGILVATLIARPTGLIRGERG
ncbi:MAG: branched-chain amino acid ABC transporter permease [Candidatus Rokubacteria bacterium]|nr:branched-chain amino acid ABC transporter permease [Candidatus Rokubacteria bacterium]MBI3106149.1 branched-chain amino acid ABC transporter permease [Candidatus Rokubacteria bacterium]